MPRQMIYRGLILVSFLLYLYPAAVGAGIVEQIIVAIDGEPYTLSNIREYAKMKMGLEFPNGDLIEVKEEDKRVLENFITEKLLAAEVKQAGIKVRSEDIDRHIDEIKEKNRISGDELRAILLREGMSMEAYRASLQSEIEKAEIVNRQVRTRVNITDQDVERYYQLNTKKYTTEARVRLRHILLPLPEQASPEQEKETMLKAKELIRRATSGEDFGVLAGMYSEGAGASEGGDIGWVKRGSLLREIEDVGFSKLSVGEISQPVRTSMGVHIIKLADRDSGQVLPLSAVSDKIRQELNAKILEERFQKWLKTDLRRKHRVDIKLPGVVFRPETAGEETVQTLMASTSRRRAEKERTFLSYLNPLSYIMTETPLEGKDGEAELGSQNVVSILGVPLFVTESGDLPEGLDSLPQAQESNGSNEGSEKSGGFFSSVWDTINPF